LIPSTWFEALSKADALSPKQLAKTYGDEAARWASLQVDLRKKARAKFANADQMLFDREALEQATHEAVAKYHASKFPVGEPVVDMTVGIGADMIALAARGPVIGFDLDELRTDYGRHNSPGSDVRTEDGLAFVLANDYPYIWADPDRRDIAGKRLNDPSAYEPDPALIFHPYFSTNTLKRSDRESNSYPIEANAEKRSLGRVRQSNPDSFVLTQRPG
jgi:hypothetical protein